MRFCTLIALCMLRAFAQQSDGAMPLMVIQMPSGETHLATLPASGEGRLSRWLDLQTASLSNRYRHIWNSAGETTANNAQFQFALRGAFKLDEEGRFAVHAGIFSGNSFTGGWNNTGLGTGAAQSNLYLKQLYVSAAPVSGIEVQYGGLDFTRGESSEITSYDYDGYLVGERVSVRRSQKLFFDEISVTSGYLGDLNRPGVLRRLPRLARSDYHQALVVKQAGRHLRVSADYTVESGVDTLRQGVTAQVRKLRLADMIHFEQYEIAGSHGGYGFAAYGEKKIAGRFSLGSGYTEHDRRGLYSDRFGRGKYLFWNTHVALSPEWSVMALVTQALSIPPGGSPRTRLDLILSYNIRHHLVAGGWF